MTTAPRGARIGEKERRRRRHVAAVWTPACGRRPRRRLRRARRREDVERVDEAVARAQRRTPAAQSRRPRREPTATRRRQPGRRRATAGPLNASRRVPTTPIVGREAQPQLLLVRRARRDAALRPRRQILFRPPPALLLGRGGAAADRGGLAILRWDGGADEGEVSSRCAGWSPRARGSRTRARRRRAHRGCWRATAPGKARSGARALSSRRAWARFFRRFLQRGCAHVHRRPRAQPARTGPARRGDAPVRTARGEQRSPARGQLGRARHARRSAIGAASGFGPLNAAPPPPRVEEGSCCAAASLASAGTTDGSSARRSSEGRSAEPSHESTARRSRVSAVGQRRRAAHDEPPLPSAAAGAVGRDEHPGGGVRQRRRADCDESLEHDVPTPQLAAERRRMCRPTRRRRGSRVELDGGDGARQRIPPRNPCLGCLGTAGGQVRKLPRAGRPPASAAAASNAPRRRSSSSSTAAVRAATAAAAAEGTSSSASKAPPMAPQRAHS